MGEHPTEFGRRDLLGLLGAAAAIGAAPATAVAASTAERPSVLGDKFFADGRVRPFAGNTIICHLPQQGEEAACFNALLNIYRAARGWDFADALTMLPPSSYHMTLFGGANDRPRRQVTWPSDLPLDMPIGACNEMLAARLRGFRMGLDMPIRMTVDPGRVSNDAKTLAIRLVPLDATEAAKLKLLRLRLADVLKIVPPTLDSYEFHITLGYLIRPLDPAHRAALQQMKQDWHRAILAKAPAIVLGPPEYCTFDDMFAYARQFYLS